MVKIKLLRPARVTHNAGETVEASPAEADFLISVGSAEMVEADAKETTEKKQPVKKTK